MLDLYETHLDVTDLARSVKYYTEALGLELAIQREVDGARADRHARGARRFALLWLDSRHQAMLGLWERPGDSVRPQHFAFQVSIGELSATVAALEHRGIQFRDFFQRRTTSPTVIGLLPAASLYFDDPDGHVLELLAPIPAPARPDLGVIPWAEWVGDRQHAD